VVHPSEVWLVQGIRQEVSELPCGIKECGREGCAGW